MRINGQEIVGVKLISGVNVGEPNYNWRIKNYEKLGTAVLTIRIDGELVYFKRYDSINKALRQVSDRNHIEEVEEFFYL